MGKIKQWMRIYGLNNIILRGMYAKLPIIPVANDEVLRRMNWQFRSKKRLYKYLKIRKEETELERKNPYPRTIWWLWFQGYDKAPAIVKKCLESVEHYAPLMGYQIIKLNETNLFQYIDFPEIIIHKWKKGKIGDANFSDICRVSLLAQYGGIWLDSTVLLTGKIDESILKADVFFYKASFLDLTVTKISNWLMSANSAGNTLLLSIRDSMYEYWESNHYIDDYFIFHLCVAALSERQELKAEFEKIPFYSNTYPQLLGRELQKRYEKEKIQHILNMSNIHKLTYKGLEDLGKDSLYGHLVTGNLERE